MAGMDPTGEIDLEDIGLVRQAIHRLIRCEDEHSISHELIDRAIDDVTRAFSGDYPGLLRCDTLYHDLRHALETGLTAARLLEAHGLWASMRGSSPIEGSMQVVVVLLALFHDVGLLRRHDEAHLWGPELTPIHEERGVDFMKTYFQQVGASEVMGFSQLIMATKLIFRMPDAWSQQEKELASILATADLLSQMADRCYLEKCRDFLFLEFSAFGLAGKDGTPYPDRETLLAKTPGFFNNVVRDRLENEFQGVHQLLDLKYGTPNPWEQSIQRNLGYLDQVINEQDYGRLRRHPKPFQGA